MDNQQTPLERLISDKERMQRQRKRQKQKLNGDFPHIQENAGSSLLSRLSSLPSSSNRSTTRTNGKNTTSVIAGQPSVALGISDYLSMAKGMIPIAQNLTQPFITMWGVKKTEKWSSNLSFKRKK